MTGPALDIINWAFRGKEAPQFIEDIATQFKILFSFGRVESGKALLHLSHAFSNHAQDQTTVSALHISPANELHHFELEDAESDYFKEIVDEGKSLRLPVQQIFKISSDIDNEIMHEVRDGNYDLLLIGMSASIYEGSLLGKIIGFTSNIIHPDKFFAHKGSVYSNKFYERTNRLLSKVDIPVGILIDKGLEHIDQIIIPIFFKEDLFLMSYAQRIMGSSEIKVTLWDVDSRFDGDETLFTTVHNMQNVDNRLSMANNESLDIAGESKKRLIMISLVSWEMLLEQKRQLNINTSSILVVRDRILTE